MHKISNYYASIIFDVVAVSLASVPSVILAFSF